MSAFHLSFVLIIILLVVTAWHFVRMSDAIRANDAEGTGQGPAFIAFLKALGCGLGAAAIGAWLLLVAGWLTIAGCAAGALCMFAGVVVYHLDKTTVPSWARASVLLSLGLFLVSIVAAVLRAVA